MKTKLTPKQETYRARLVGKLHAIKKQRAMNDDEYRALLSGFDAYSSSELSIEDLLRAIELLEGNTAPKTKHDEELDKWRKRVIAAIGAWLRAMNNAESIDIIKGVACRATEAKAFNTIPLERLRSIYAAFTNKKKDLAFADKLTASEIDLKSFLN